MIKRLLWLTIGFLLGMGSSIAAVRRLRRVAARYAPPEIAQRWGDRATAVGRDVRSAVRDGRTEMQRREMEMRASLDPRDSAR